MAADVRADLAVLLPDYLARQRWFGAEDSKRARIVELEILDDGPPSLLWLLVDVEGAVYQQLVGLRPLEQTERFLEGKGLWMLGDLDTDKGPMLAYDALVDPDLALQVLALAAPNEEAERVRPLGVEQSNTSVVFDERLILKLFRKVEVGPNPDVEMTDALCALGYEHIVKNLGSWRRDGRDLAVTREYLAGGGDGWQLALTSLRDIYGSRVDPAEAGGDISPEARRLGEVTGALHVALGKAFGVARGEAGAWADSLESYIDELQSDLLETEMELAGARQAYADLRSVRDPGSGIRVHGDLHLGQVMRTDAGWYLLDFEGEPLAPISDRARRWSPLRDVAGMLRSFSYVSEVALRDQGEGVDDELRSLARRWEAHAGAAFLEGYVTAEGIEALLPADETSRQIVLNAFVIGKAVYEVGYELAHRPDWVDIPLTALGRLTGAPE